MVGKMVLLAAICLITACAGSLAQREQARQEVIDGYIGKNIEEIFEQFGHADSLSESPDGNRVFVYSSFHISSSSVRCEEGKDRKQSCRGGDVSELWCKTYFEVDSENVVVSTSNKGNSCDSCAKGGGFVCLN